MAAPRPLTVDDLDRAQLPDRWELIGGRLVEMAPASSASSRIGGRVFALLLDYERRSGLGWAYPTDAGFVLFDDRATVRSPDAAFVRAARLDRPEQDGFVPVAPDLAVELLSPSDRIADALAKIAMYLDAGVRLVWLVDPARRSVTVFTPDETPTVLLPGAALDGDDILPGFAVPVADLFA